MASGRILTAFAIFLVWGISAASAEYLAVDVEKIPVERLVKNLEEQIRKNPQDVKAVLNLARAHAMAYSKKAETLTVFAKDPDQVWVLPDFPIVPFRKVVETKDPEKLKAAQVHLEAALKHYADALKLKPDDGVVQLGYAWLLTQTDKKADAIAALRKVIQKAWLAKEPREAGTKDGIFLAAEAGEYLLPLLDPEKNKSEIASLKDTEEEFKKLPRFVTPIAVPLSAGLSASDLEDRAAHVIFDADGRGPRSWTWITRDAAWLVYDAKGRGKVTSGLQLFGNVTFWMFWETGYDALAALDDDHDGRLAGRELEGLALWQDLNGNGVSEPGEVRPLSHYGVVAIACEKQRDEAHPDRIAFSPMGVTFRDGTTRPTFDLVLHSR